MVKRDYFQLEPPLSLYRYVAIMRPLQPRMSKRRNLAIAAVIWISSSLISCPMLLFFKTEEVRIHTYIVDCNNIFSIFVCVSPFLYPQGASNQAEQLTHRLLLRVARWSDEFLQAGISVSIPSACEWVCVWKEGHMSVVCCIRNCTGP